MKLDLGCGTNKLKDFIGVDVLPFAGVDWSGDLREEKWTFTSAVLPAEEGINLLEASGATGRYQFTLKDAAVSEVHCSHFLEHLTGQQRVFFFNELYRVMKVGALARIITPHWSHERAYGDPTHAWPPVCGWTYLYLFREWRESNAPHVGYNCDFDYQLRASHDPNDSFLASSTMKEKAERMYRNLNTATDLQATLTKRRAT